ncbi:MAG: multiheme c-type cytochrome [Chloroflexota bacterium]|jgi:hypothetical protein
MMKKLFLVSAGIILVALAFILGVGRVAPVTAQGDPVPDFVGKEACATCHADIVAQHQLHGHNWKLNRVEGAAPDYPFTEVPNPPEGYTWDDISFVIGGFAYKARFIDQNGFIITGDADSTTQYNFPLIDARTGEVIVEAGWVPYNAGKETPYNCGSCHTTGYNHDPNAHMYDMPGLIGLWEEEGIQCEECHGPGSLHVQNPIRVNMLVDRASEACGQCHYRGAEGVIESKGGFIDHHEQYEEIATAPHAALECIDCHNPHQSVKYAESAVNPNQGMRVNCTSCHFDNKNLEKHEAAGVTCVECHMPPMVASGARSPERLWADVRAHLFQINTDPTAPQFNEDGTAVMPYITVEYACKRCHLGLPVEAMASIATGYHDR